MPTAHPTEHASDLLPDASTRVLEDEWLETNGLGGYASSTPALCPTRRYHGLLVTPLPGREGRYVLLSRFDEQLRVHREPWPFSVARYPGVHSPEGHRALEQFETRPWPRASYELGGARLTREIQLVPKRAAVLVRYAISQLDAPAELELRPLLPYRAFNELAVRNEALDPRVLRSADGFQVRPYEELPGLCFRWSGPTLELQNDPCWYERVEYAAELERGYDGHEDQWSPGVLRAHVDGPCEIVVAVSLSEPVEDPRALWDELAEQRQRRDQAAAQGARGTLELAADAYLYQDPVGRAGVLAGYPWFQEWGRDTFLALPGLTLARGQHDACADVLSGALPYLKGGLLPNIYGDTQESCHYGSVDAALWFARAVRCYQRSGGSRERVLDEYLPALIEIASAWSEGTDLGIRMEEGGLVDVGTPELNPTWMDARVDGEPVTPRHGQPVEIEALWYSLLNQLERLHANRGELKESERWAKLRRRAKRSFLARFWLPERGTLADVWRREDEGGEHRDASVRPNAVIAAALEYSPLSRSQRASVADVTREELLTPYGLRTLARWEEGYRGRYEGPMSERDGAYHQGTVWPWLLGFYTESRLRAVSNARGWIDELRALWAPLLEDLERHGLGQLSEVYDGDAPHRPNGTPAQAWSVGEALRALAMLERGRP